MNMYECVCRFYGLFRHEQEKILYSINMGRKSSFLMTVRIQNILIIILQTLYIESIGHLIVETV